jgi:hypothetical protein
MEPANHIEHHLRQARRQTERWLVEHKEAWIRHHGAADRQHLLFASGQRPGRLALPFEQPRDVVVDPVKVARGGRAGAAQRPAESQVSATLSKGNIWRPSATWAIPNSQTSQDPGGEPRDVAPLPQDASGCRGQHARYRADQGRLAGTVRADDANEVSASNLQVHPRQGDRHTVTDLQARHGQHGVPGGTAARSATVPLGRVRLAEIALQHQWILHYLLRRPLGDLRTVVQHDAILLLRSGKAPRATLDGSSGRDGNGLWRNWKDGAMNNRCISTYPLQYEILSWCSAWVAAAPVVGTIPCR